MVYEGRRRQLSESEIIQSEMSEQELLQEKPISSGIGSQSGATNEWVRPAEGTNAAEVSVANQSDSLVSGELVKLQPDSLSKGSLAQRASSGVDSVSSVDSVTQTSFLEMTKSVGGSFVGFVSEAIDGNPASQSPKRSVASRLVKSVSQQAGSEGALNTDQDRGELPEELGGEISEDDTRVFSGGEFILDPSAGEDQASSAGAAESGEINDEQETFLRRLLRGPEDPRELQRWGFVYLFLVEALLLARLLLDPLMVRRPLLDPNLTTGGLYFIGISLFIFMMANVVTSSPRVQVQQGPELGPGYAMMNLLPAIPTRPISDQPGGVIPPRVSELTPQQLDLAKIAKTLAILAQFSIVVGIVLIGSRHFSNVRAGVGCSLLYLLLPYTAQMTGRVDHVLPAALLLWAVLFYRRPLVSGIFLGFAGGLVYYPLFLLPLWGSFYWRRGARKFGAGVAAVLILMMIALSFDSSASLSDHLYRMFGLLKPNRDPQEFRGLWALGWNPIWRLPVIVGFAILATFFSIWPARKNLGTLMSSSAALMVAAQFWHGYGGGLYIAWFMPLLLLVIFRPNLQDRIAAKVVVGTQPTIVLGETETEPA